MNREKFLAAIDSRFYDSLKYEVNKEDMKYCCPICQYSYGAFANKFCWRCGANIVNHKKAVVELRHERSKKIAQQDEQYYIDMAEVLCVDVATIRLCTNFVAKAQGGLVESRRSLFNLTEEMLAFPV
jgi:hypothetical protein